MISNILSGKLTSSYQKKKLVSLEDCYMHLKPYFRLKKSAKSTRTDTISVQEKSKSAKVQNAFNSIEQNQILYAKIMTERLLKV
jgi:disulfide oxidoreductase YuzD